MNIINLNNARLILRKELTNSMKEEKSDEFHRLALIIGDLEVLMNRITNPKLAKKMDKLTNGI